ncbi:MAG TPA: hypothetical protein DDZ51_30320 [Planctomycetaceae bacterium]|nr:hypothetical protein [Planctomycetaceae bacterium]
MKQTSATIAANHYMVDRIGVFETRKSRHKSAFWRYKNARSILARRKPKTELDPSADRQAGIVMTVNF